ncbi:hypothetical protein HanPSC8_Chr08g0332091 [Helianthus annuus]|nr:hypothetical protein HanPSC8_Chr08g0332091 [Helianthus annuus]
MSLKPPFYREIQELDWRSGLTRDLDLRDGRCRISCMESDRRSGFRTIKHG